MKPKGLSEEKALWLRACASLAEDPRSVPRAHTKQLSTACNSSSRGSDTLFCSTSNCFHVHLSPHRHTCIHITKKKNKSSLQKDESKILRTKDHSSGLSIMTIIPINKGSQKGEGLWWWVQNLEWCGIDFQHRRKGCWKPLEAGNYKQINSSLQPPRRNITLQMSEF